MCARLFCSYTYQKLLREHVRLAVFGLAGLLLLSGFASGAGFLVIGPIEPIPVPVPVPVPDHRHIVPRQPVLHPIQVKSHQVTASLKSGIAVTSVEQVFHNPNARQLEGTYIFPLADDAAVQAFSLWMNGQEVKGELLEANKARGIYEDIVRRMKDPGLLEYVGKRMFKCRVFPSPATGDCRIKLTYTHQLKREGGLAEFTYPLRARTGETGNTGGTQGLLSVAVDITDTVDIRNIYSPTHAVDIKRKDARHIKVSFEAKNVSPERDFKLFYNVSSKEVGLSLIPFKPDGEDGYFMAILTPRDTASDEEVVGKDIVFVLDRSGSMLEGGKIFQAQKALSFCLASLNPKDNFGLISFSTEAEAYHASMQAASRENIQKAVNHVEKKILARGGTAIDEAMQMALKMNTNKDRPFMVVFLTDGEPTIGERDPTVIARNVKGAAEKNVRVFCFGLGFDVNSDLLEQLARDNRGSSTFVVPKENIEVKVSAFYTRVSSPVLTDAAVEFVGLDAYDVYPKNIGDVFRDQQITVVGRYRKGGAHAVALRGKMKNRDKEIVHECTFPDKETTNDFIPRIWALRKVGYMLDSIRLHGESKEVREEVVRLSKQYGIMTPYTSWLVIEDYKQRTRPRVTQPGRPTPVPPPVMPMEEAVDGVLREGGMNAPTKAAEARARYDMAVGNAEPEGVEDGDADRINMAEFARDMKKAGEGGLHFGERGGYTRDKARRLSVLGAKKEAPSTTLSADQAAYTGRGHRSAVTEKLTREQNLASDGTYRLKNAEGKDLVKHAGGRTFYQRNGVWLDSTITGKESKVSVKLLSEEYFKLLKDKPSLAKFFALGKQVAVRLGDTVYEVRE